MRLALVLALLLSAHALPASAAGSEGFAKGDSFADGRQYAGKALDRLLSTDEGVDPDASEDADPDALTDC